MVSSLPANESLPIDEALALYAPTMERLLVPGDIETPLLVNAPDAVERHGYWGPLPGETLNTYRALGVTTFKRYHLPNGDLARNFLLKHSSAEFNSGEYPQEGTREERLEELVSQTKLSEVLHLASGAVAATLLAKGLFGHSEAMKLGMGGGIVYGGLYPALLQRYNRLRAYSALERLGRLASNRKASEKAGTGSATVL